LLTAAHCTELLINGGVVPDKVWITFEPNALTGTPEENQDLYLEIAEIIQHPEYKPGKEFNDIALILLTEPVVDLPLVDLPPENYIEDILQQPPRGKGKGNLDFIFVGYGATGPWELPYLHLDAERRVGTTSFVNVLPSVLLVNNISPEDAVICDGDSGGPIFHVVSPGKEVFVGLHSREGSSETPCDGLGPSYKTRVDTANARTFIFENLP
jgi:secreted trypsin-like serine protease